MPYPAPDEIPYDVWFDNKINPLDLMPIATDNPRPEEEIADDINNMHEKMYRIATAKYNPFAVGGSESLKKE